MLRRLSVAPAARGVTFAAGEASAAGEAVVTGNEDSIAVCLYTNSRGIFCFLRPAETGNKCGVPRSTSAPSGTTEHPPRATIVPFTALPLQEGLPSRAEPSHI